MKIRSITAIVFLFCVVSVSDLHAQCRSEAFPSFTFSESSVFPADKSLKRPEDGKMLPDGRIVVGDEDFGLRVIDKEGKHKPFGKFKEAGYSNSPPETAAAANGVFIDKDGKTLLVADIYTGYIYEVDVATEATKIIYKHRYGTNSVIRDDAGNIWFTQSALNSIETGPGAMWASVDKPAPTGEVYRLEKGADIAARVADSIYYANGIAMSADGKRVFVSETMMDRVLSFEIDGYGMLVNPTTYATVLTPDNLEIDSNGNLYVASPLSSSVYAIDAKCRSIHRVFENPTKHSMLAQQYYAVNSRTGGPIVSLLTRESFAPMPGLVTGMFFSNDGKTLYVSGLGTALMRFDVKK